MKNTIHFFLLFLTFATASAQQNPQPYFRNYSTEHGLPSPEVYCAFEDSRGYMWFGTDNGAARFDGYDFKTFDAQNGLTSNVVFDIHEDGKGRIWFGTMTGEAFILEGDTVVEYKYNHLVTQYKSRFDGAGLVHLRKDETAFFALVGYGLVMISGEGKLDTIVGTLPSSKLIIHFEDFIETIVDFAVHRTYRVYEDWNQRLEKEMTTWIEVAISGNRGFRKKLSRLKVHGQGHDAQFLPGGELLNFNASYLYCLRDSQILWRIPYLDMVNEIYAEKDGSIWMCLNRGKGLRKYQNLASLRAGDYDQYLDGISISKIFKDSKNGYWITTLADGLFHFPNNQILTFNKSVGLSDDFITSIAIKDSNNLFIGCKNADLYKLSIKENKVALVGKSLDENSPNNSLLYDDVKDVLWGSDFFVKDKKKGSFFWWNPRREKDEVWFRDVYLDNFQFNSKRQLIGNKGFSGFYILDIVTNRVVFGSVETRLKGRVYGLFSDKQDRLWLSKKNGIYEFKDSLLIRPELLNTHPAFQNRVESITQLPDSTLVFGTKGYGVMTWKGDKIQQINTDQGLTSNMLEYLHVDESGTLWAGTLNGLNKITFDENGKAIVRRFTTANGLPSNEINEIKSHNNQLWLSTSRGLVKFSEPPRDTISTKPILQSISINNKPLIGRQTQSFQHNQNNFTFQYLAINYRQNGKIPYRYRIHEKDKWQQTLTRIANYPALTPGNYTFEIQAQNQDGYWSESTSFSFKIAHPWWATIWFRILFGALLAATFYGFFKYRTNQLTKENLVQKEITTLERAALQAQMNPHFIFNCLNSIQNYILKNDQKKAVEFLSRFARLVRLNLNASVNGEIALEDEISLLENYLVLEQERFDHTFDYELTVDEDLRAQFVEIPPMLIQPYVENAVIHGLANKEGRGEVRIDFGSEGEAMLVTVTDNGVGYREGANGNKDQRHKSIGMTVTRKRLELLGANLGDSVKIRTLRDSDNKVLGTEVRIVIKLNG